MSKKRVYFSKNNHGVVGIPSQNLIFYCAIGFFAFRVGWRRWAFRVGLCLNSKDRNLPACIDIYLTFWTLTIFLGSSIDEDRLHTKATEDEG